MKRAMLFVLAVLVICAANAQECTCEAGEELYQASLMKAEMVEMMLDPTQPMNMMGMHMIAIPIYLTAIDIQVDVLYAMYRQGLLCMPTFRRTFVRYYAIYNRLNEYLARR